MMKKFFFCAFLLSGHFFLSNGQQKIAFKTGKMPPVIVSKVHSDSLPVLRLFLAGNFNGWNPADTLWQLRPDGHGAYYINKQLSKGPYQFKVTRASWQTVECAADGKPIDNRTVNVSGDTTVTLDIAAWQDSFAPVEKQHTASPQVHIITEKFDIPQLGRQRRVWIYLPADYATSKRKYPVIYMHDGQNLFDAYTSGYGEWGIDEILDKMPDKEASIIVGIDHGGEYRITEYDPFDSKYGKGRGGDYVDFLAKTLKPYIDGHYRTKTDVGHTTIAGSSMGGLISMYAVLKYPDVFGNAGIFSPAFWVAAPDIYKYAQQQTLPAYSRFYFVCGDAEGGSMVTDMQKMADIIRAKGKGTDKTPVVIINGASHNEKQWNGDFPGFYEWLVGQ
jgi:predicted alpha/beta superfamily hydrolase